MATILIVDDDRDCRRPLAMLLKHEGYEIHEASNGLEGMEALNRRDYDLVLLDLVMPVVNGVNMLQAIRNQPRWKNLPVFLVTAQHDSQMLTNARAIGIQEYIFKGDTPFMKLLELVKRHLKESFTPRRRGRKPKIRPQVEQTAMQKPVRSFYSPAPGMTQTSASRCPDRQPRPKKWSQFQLDSHHHREDSITD